MAFFSFRRRCSNELPVAAVCSISFDSVQVIGFFIASSVPFSALLSNERTVYIVGSAVNACKCTHFGHWPIPSNLIYFPKVLMSHFLRMPVILAARVFFRSFFICYNIPFGSSGLHVTFVNFLLHPSFMCRNRCALITLSIANAEFFA